MNRILQFKIPLEDIRALAVMQEVANGWRADDQPFMDHEVWCALERDVPNGSGLREYMWSRDWQTDLGPGRLEAIEYQVIQKGVQTRQTVIAIQGSVCECGPLGYQWDIAIDRQQISFDAEWDDIDRDMLRAAINERVHHIVQDMVRAGEGPWDREERGLEPAV